MSSYLQHRNYYKEGVAEFGKCITTSLLFMVSKVGHYLDPLKIGIIIVCSLLAFTFISFDNDKEIGIATEIDVVSHITGLWLTSSFRKMAAMVIIIKLRVFDFLF